MKNLAAVMDKIEAGSPDQIQEQVDLALGLWSSSHSTTHRIMTISESSVAFADAEGVIWAATYNISEGEVVAITNMKPLLNVQEELDATDWLDPLCEEIVAAVVENREADAEAVLGTILETKQKAVRSSKLVKINDPIVRRRNFMKKSASQRWNTIQAAKKTAKRTALKPTKKIRMAASMKRRKLYNLGGAKATGAGHSKSNISESDQDILEGLESLPVIGTNLLTGLLARQNDIVIEGHILERDEMGAPLSIIRKGSTGVLPLVAERYYSTGHEVDVPADTIKVSGGKDDEFVPAGMYDVKKANPRSTTLCQRGEGGDHKTYTCSTSAIKKHKKLAAKAKNVQENADGTKVLAAEPAVIVNLGAIREHFDAKDFFPMAAAAWEAFRAEPVTEDVQAILADHNPETVSETVAKVVDLNGFLTLCTEAEIFEYIEPFATDWDITNTKALAKAIHEAAGTEEGIKEREAFLSNFRDQTLVEELTADDMPISEALDCLFLESDQFDFGGADELGSDDLEDDDNTEGMGDDEDDLEDDLDDEGNDDLDDEGEDTIQVDINVSDLRDDMNTILDVIGDEIEDNDEFDELKDKFADDEEEIEPEDVTRLLGVIGDYFQAVSSEKSSRAEEEAEDELEGENLDDMEGEGADDPSKDDMDGAGDDDLGGGDEDLELGA